MYGTGEGDRGTCPTGIDFWCHSTHCWVVSVYYGFVSLSLLVSLYCFCIASFVALYGYGYALRGSPSRAPCASNHYAALSNCRRRTCSRK